MLCETQDERTTGAMSARVMTVVASGAGTSFARATSGGDRTMTRTVQRVATVAQLRTSRGEQR